MTLSFFKKSSRILKNNRGTTLIFAYLVITLLMGFGAAFLILTSNEGLTAQRNQRTNQAFYLAEAGIERALYDLRKDFVNNPSNPSWADGDINGMSVGPNTASFFAIPYSSTAINGGSYSVQLMNVSGINSSIWIRSTGTVGDAVQTIQVYAQLLNINPWNNAIFAGTGASGALINGNVDIRGSVHILGNGLSPTDYAVDLGGTAEMVGNNYTGFPAAILPKVPAIATTVFNGENVSTLNATLRVKRGLIGLSGSSTIGESNIAGNATKETVDGVYVTHGFAGTQGSASVHSDNGWSNGYDLGNSVAFPSLSDPYPGYSSYQDYLRSNALVISAAADLNNFASITPNSSFTYSNAQGSISMDGSGNLAVSGIVYIDGGTLGMGKAGADKTITYTGTGSIVVTGNAQIDVNLITAGNNSFPNNILGIMTPGDIGFNEAGINVMGLFYAENAINAQKQTNIVGSIVSNYFNMGTNVPSVFQVPAVIGNMPPGIIGQNSSWVMKIVSWQKI